VASKIREEGEFSFLCMATGCSLTVPDSFIQKVTDEATFQRFHEIVVRHYVAHQAQLKFCPSPSCVYTIKCQSGLSKTNLSKVVPTVRCAAGHAFCFGCPIESDHRPLVCSAAKLWLKKCQDDSETANWIKSNTKECSKCQSTIEKNGGCKYVSSFVFKSIRGIYTNHSHMTCKKCRYEYVFTLELVALLY
jgi:ariadne-1